LGFETYTADPSKVYKKKKLGDLSILENMPEQLQGTF
jgi:hypothetical protein